MEMGFCIGMAGGEGDWVGCLRPILDGIRGGVEVLRVV